MVLYTNKKKHKVLLQYSRSNLFGAVKFIQHLIEVSLLRVIQARVGIFVSSVVLPVVEESPTGFWGDIGNVVHVVQEVSLFLSVTV